MVRLIFAKFAELGTLHGVLRWLVDHDVQLGMRLHAGPDKGELGWRRPNRMTLQNILHSPVYAGIYAYGRRRVDPRRQLPGRPSTGRVVRGQDQWLVAIPGCCRPTSPSRPIRPTWPGWPPTPPTPISPGWCVRGRRCCRGWRAVDAAGGA